jgi:hypothetical protein
MNIEKEYELTLDDLINYQNFSLRKQSQSRQHHAIRWLVFYLPPFYILFSINYIEDITVMWIGLIISFLVFLYYIIFNLFAEKLNSKFLKKNFYKNFVSENVKLIITEHSIMEYNHNSEQKYLPEWVCKCESNKDYLFLLNAQNLVLILPKKYFSNDEQENITKYYGGRREVNKDEQNK